MQDGLFEFADEQVLGEQSPAFLESWSRQLRNDTTMSPQLKSFFSHRHIYSLWSNYYSNIVQQQSKM
jgi:hypothetical protein